MKDFEKEIEVCKLIIIEDISTEKACKQVGLNTGTFYNKLADIPDLSDNYARAKIVQAWRLVDLLWELANDASEDRKVDKDGKPYFDHDHISRVKLRVDTLKWIVGKTLPKLYGDRIDLTSGGDKINNIPISQWAKE